MDSPPLAAQVPGWFVVHVACMLPSATPGITSVHSGTSVPIGEEISGVLQLVSWNVDRYAMHVLGAV
jgi:predicted metal-binding membrane protein